MRAARVLRRLLLGAALLGLAACAPAPTGTEAPLDVFAAASLQESMDAVAQAYERETGQVVRMSYAGSSALARQIEQRAPADVFVSADGEWMDWLQSRGLVDGASRQDLLGNSLVLIAPAGSQAPPVVLDTGTDLAALLGADGRLSLALVDSVPAGRYARAALQSLGLWEGLRSRVAESDNVRAALLLVARGEAPLGVVYGSDARVEPRVRVLATFPSGSHPEIVYPAAKVAASRHPGADAFLHWLQSPQASEIFRRHGFELR